MTLLVAPIPLADMVACIEDQYSCLTLEAWCTLPHWTVNTTIMMSLNSIASGRMSQQRLLPLFSNALHQEVGPFTSVRANKDKIYNLKGD